jgi:hypothetical protein
VVIGFAFQAVFDVRKPAIKAALGRIEALPQPLKASRNGDGDIIGVLVNDTLDEFQVF